MAVIDARIPGGPGQAARLRAALVKRRAQGAQMVSAARLRLRRPALTIGGLACFDIAAFSTDRILGWAVTGLSLWALEAFSAEDAEDGDR